MAIYSPIQECNWRPIPAKLSCASTGVNWKLVWLQILNKRVSIIIGKLSARVIFDVIFSVFALFIEIVRDTNNESSPARCSFTHLFGQLTVVEPQL